MNLRTDYFIVDMGSSWTRIGYGTEKEPKYILPSYVGVPQYTMIEEGSQKGIIGDNLKTVLSDIQIRQIYNKGNVVDFDVYEILLDSIIPFQLSLKPEESTLVLTQDNWVKRPQRQKLCSVAFEKFNFKSILFSKTPTLTAFSVGRSTGVVVDSGNSFTTATVVHDGYSFGSSCKRNEYAGRVLSNEVKKYIEETTGKPLITEAQLKHDDLDPSVINYHQMLLCNQIKETVYSANQTSKDYTLPDKQVVKINKQKIPDIFSRTYKNDVNYQGLSSMVNEVIQQSELEIKLKMFENIIVSGGSTFVNGFSSTLESQLKKLAPLQSKVGVISMPRRKESSWLGASIISSVSSIQPFCVSKHDYKEIGVSILDKKCP